MNGLPNLLIPVSWQVTSKKVLALLQLINRSLKRVTKYLLWRVKVDISIEDKSSLGAHFSTPSRNDALNSIFDKSQIPSIANSYIHSSIEIQSP